MTDMIANHAKYFCGPQSGLIYSSAVKFDVVLRHPVMLKVCRHGQSSRPKTRMKTYYDPIMFAVPKYKNDVYRTSENTLNVRAFFCFILKFPIVSFSAESRNKPLVVHVCKYYRISVSCLWLRNSTFENNNWHTEFLPRADSWTWPSLYRSIGSSPLQPLFR